MEITNHAVMPGETLGQIASRYNSTVAQLRQLNPFITNADNVKVGWNLSVPKALKQPPRLPLSRPPRRKRLCRQPRKRPFSVPLKIW